MVKGDLKEGNSRVSGRGAGAGEGARTGREWELQG